MRRIAALLITFVVAACSTPPGGPTHRVETFLGGAEPTRVIHRPAPQATVEAFRIDGMAYMENRAGEATEKLHGYPLLAGPVPVDDASAAVVRDVLTSDATYLWDIAKACEFLPGVAIRFHESPTTVDVLICFSCDELEVVVNGKKTGHEDFDPRRADLVRVAKGLFPDDDKIQSLK